ncbi:hypothetical protein BDV27DRAFT_119766 [Aspergillus caelatus]|uniref:Uncharacterized protein n=1 Tax=Aspergillus caelatus TaxID=61420 RepID=A0A5N7AJX9_9EURO|nr:uncharacterized protein BDV27DRAFT_119766 [Aspergillus caelatus]KAE8370177.1 hypothetical protein BDV27DRAFT_119766 [Aspergillus caelatus]
MSASKLETLKYHRHRPYVLYATIIGMYSCHVYTPASSYSILDEPDIVLSSTKMCMSSWKV